MIPNKKTRKNPRGLVCCGLLALLLVSQSHATTTTTSQHSHSGQQQQQQLQQQASHIRSLHEIRPQQESEDVLPAYRHELKEQQRNRDLTISVPPRKKQLVNSGMGEIGPGGMPDLVVYHYGKSPLDAEHENESDTTNDSSLSLEDTSSTSNIAFPGLAEFDRTQQNTVGRTRMRGNTLQESSNTRGGLSLGWGTGIRQSGGGKGGGKGSKSGKSGKSGKADTATAKCSKKGKSDKADSYCEEGDDDDDSNGTGGGGGDYGDIGSGGNGSGGGGDYGDIDSGGNGSGGNGDGGNGDGSGGDGSGGNGGEDEWDDSGSGGDGSSGSDGSDGSSGSPGLCQDFLVSFTSPDSQSGEVRVVFLRGAANEPSPQGVAALVETFNPPVFVSDSTGFDVKMGFVIDTSNAKRVDDKDGSGTFTETDVAMTLDAAVNPPVALDVAGCSDAAMQKAGEYYEANKIVREEDYRRLQGADTKLVILRDWVCQNGSCSRDGGDNCDLECSTTLYYYGDLTPTEVRARINAALLKFMMLVDDVTNWYPKGQTPTINIEQVETAPRDPNSIEQTNRESSERTKAGPYIGAAAGALALLLLLILFVRRSRRNQDNEEVSHLKLEDDDGDDTFIQEIASDDGTPERQYQSRGVHVVGENDSIFSGWTGYTGNRPIDDGQGNEMNNGRLGHVSTDVHQCSSATCEACEVRRQQGVNFVAANSPSHPGTLPNYASREYTAEDTVAL
ncbi:hypothetical protein IV203_020648 [Nitzschia inconspicua]|uniref:Uncharacterized protein n=1 Tax=Nitzschia inconspicua TaxID=303405 RepID=A0A9K3PF97_9STRA|nr:hypothetical protein IV203_034421 [Nitzschia inconspicua]KAG7342704.1 hypothetical protein IV203_020648 [Nitzschia inconspicua]